MLDQETTMKLVKQAQNGDADAKNCLLIENSPLVKCVIKRFINKGIEYDDLYQLGSLGLLKAINNFDISFNVKFSTYVVPMIIGEIKRFMRDDGSIKVSRAIKGLNVKINRYIEQYKQNNNTSPTTGQIAEHFETTTEEIVFAMDSARLPISIYTPLDEDSGKQLLVVDRFVEMDYASSLVDKLNLKSALEELDARDKKIVLLRFFRDKTQSEIAEELGVSQVQVSRLENKVLEKLRQKVKEG